MPWRKGNRLRLVPESQAPETTLPIYEDVKRSLGLPQVDVYFQALGFYPSFLQLHWRAVRPVISTQEFFSLAERLRADAYTRVHSYFEVPDLCSQLIERNFSAGARDEMTYVTELFHYSEPIVLLLAAAQFQAFDSPVGRDAPTHPASPPLFEQRPVLITEEIAPPASKQIYEDVKKTFEIPFIPSPFQALARWPEFLALYWDTMKRVAQSPVFEGCHYGVRETAFALTREFPVVIEMPLSDLAESGLQETEAASVVRITELFVNALSSIVLCSAYARIAIEGGTRTLAPKREPEPAKSGKSEQAA